MKVSEITEAKFAKPEIMYHGTRKDNLKTILSQGLLTRKSGTGWGSEIGGDQNTRDMSAIGGVYLARGLSTAYDAARDMSDEFGDDPIVVVVQYQPRHGVVDEDNIEFSVNVTADKASGIAGNMLVALVQTYQDTDTGELLIQRMAQKTREEFKRHPDAERIANETVRDELARRLSHKELTDDVIDEASEKTGVAASKIMNMIPSTPEEGEERYRKALRRLTVAVKKAVYGKDAHFTLRSRQDIGFRGANKIVSIIGFEPEDASVNVLYGKLPEDAINDIEKMGYNLK